MNILRTFLRVLASNGFRLSILLLAIACTILALAGSPQNVKQTLRDSGVYATMPSLLVDHAEDFNGNEHQDGQGQAAAVFNQPQVKAAAQQTLTPQFLQTTTEQVVDGTYHWLDGTAAQPDFNVDLQPVVTAFENKAADAATDHLKGLPACTVAQLQTINPSTADPFQLPCAPPGLNVTAERQKYIDSLAANSNNQFLKDPVLTADTLTSATGGQPITQRFSGAPKAFAWLQRSPWILGGLAIVCGAATVLLHRNRARGWRSLALSLAGTGMVLLLISLLTGYIFSHYITAPNGPLHLKGDGAEQVAVNFANSLQHTAAKTLLSFGVVYLVLGVLVLIAVHAAKRRQLHHDKQGTILDDRHDDYQSHRDQLETLANDAQAARDSKTDGAAATTTPRGKTAPSAKPGAKQAKQATKIQG